jgi:ATP-dependent HslUV protease subunit HslV
MSHAPTLHGTTILLVQKDGRTVLAGDGQVTLQNTIVKHTARKVRRLFDGKILAGFAGATADAFALFARFEKKLRECGGNLERGAVELAQEWRTDRSLRHLEALMLVTDGPRAFLLSGTGDIIEPEDGVLGIGSGGALAQAAAQALLRHSTLTAEEVAREAMAIAAGICIYTNERVVLESLPPAAEPRP